MRVLNKNNSCPICKVFYSSFSINQIKLWFRKRSTSSDHTKGKSFQTLISVMYFIVEKLLKNSSRNSINTNASSNKAVSLVKSIKLSRISHFWKSISNNSIREYYVMYVSKRKPVLYSNKDYTLKRNLVNILKEEMSINTGMWYLCILFADSAKYISLTKTNLSVIWGFSICFVMYAEININMSTIRTTMV